jgi:hypothetical protein
MGQSKLIGCKRGQQRSAKSTWTMGHSAGEYSPLLARFAVSRQRVLPPPIVGMNSIDLEAIGSEIGNVMSGIPVVIPYLRLHESSRWTFHMAGLYLASDSCHRNKHYEQPAHGVTQRRKRVGLRKLKCWNECLSFLLMLAHSTHGFLALASFGDSAKFKILNNTNTIESILCLS